VEDDLITALIPAARQAIESEIQRPIGVQTFEIGLEYFPFFLQFPKSPFVELVSAKYIDSDGAEHTVFDLETSPPTTSGIYILDELKGIMNVKVGEHWPLTILNYGYPVHIRYKAGFDPLPAALKQAMLRMVAHLYANREAVFRGRAFRCRWAWSISAICTARCGSDDQCRRSCAAASSSSAWRPVRTLPAKRTGHGRRSPRFGASLRIRDRRTSASAKSNSLPSR
jgi:hypothetical protein